MSRVVPAAPRQQVPLAVSIPDVSGLTVTQAAYVWVKHGVPVVPFDPTAGKGKSCWNLYNYDELAFTPADIDDLRIWVDFENLALATSPGAIVTPDGFRCVVFDIDSPNLAPRYLRHHLSNLAVPYINTRPNEHPRRGHYWFTVDSNVTLRTGEGIELRNTRLVNTSGKRYGEVRCLGGGIVLPPFGDRTVIRTGTPPPLPDELLNEILKAGAGGEQQSITTEQFIARYITSTRPAKLSGLVNLHARILNSGENPHDCMGKVLLVGLGEAKIGYISAAAVIRTLGDIWAATDRPNREFQGLVSWSVKIVESSDPREIKARSDRHKGSDSRRYFGKL